MAGFETGFTSQPRQASLARMIAEMRQRADAAQTETVTGRPADIAARVGGRMAEVVELQARLGDLDAFAENMSLAEIRGDAMARGLKELRQIAVDLAADAEGALSSGLDAARQTIAATARSALERVVATLNLSVGGRALFAGDRADGVALADAGAVMSSVRSALSGAASADAAYAALTADFDAPGGSFRTGLYLGGAGDPPATAIAPGETIRVDIRADDPALSALVRDIAALAAASEGQLALGGDQSAGLARRAAAGLRATVEEIAMTEARLGADQERMALAKSRATAEEAALSIALNDLIGGDSYRAAIEVTELEGQLQTLFATTARLGALSLVNLLR